MNKKFLRGPGAVFLKSAPGFFLFFVLLIVAYSHVFPCTLIMAGKDATVDGSVLLAHNNDLPGHIAAMIHIVPAAQHSPDEMIVFKTGLEIPQVPQTYRLLIMQCYYGFAEGDAKAINQYQVAVAGGLSLKADRSDKARELDPLVEGGVTGYVRYIALQRARTAGECVEIIGEMYSKYGIAYPSGVGVADPNEVWYIEVGGGRCWVAQRVPDDHYLAAANGYRIGEINFKDKKNFIYPPYLKSYAIKKGLWKPGKTKKTPFNFARIFGGKKEAENDYYNARRVWRAQQLLTPSLKQDPDAWVHPWALKPDRKITIPQLIAVLRDYYQGTPFDISKSAASASNGGKRERAIGIFRTVHTSVIQLRGDLPPEIGAVLWGGLSSALTTPFIPYYYGIKEIPASYQVAGPEFDKRSGFWHFRSLTVLLEPRLSQLIGYILPVWQDLESRLFSMQVSVEKTALELYKKDKEQANDFLTVYSYGLSLKALEMAKKLKAKLETKLAENLDEQ
ncbi:MAG: C69 family dipeptidase [Candidatus Aminicenantes bacterium]|nr:C69 family dipeptidase [Candidatus Aminicenantes bacterium]NIM78796.1 C69 family dipeptidase [Candidatus Aminicenantes bacterium]NIN18051.1 C69 family dipeptidase [Candidatus Aminicenantes bacterium]NIN41951.1 C69 family dipeptidase [Candidatus Aminicenantes bacterium]NIN84706.1 C69 family dipeptidase [Candidatus Aminicenantes bacterium]